MTIEEPDFIQETRKIIERIRKASAEGKGVRLSAHEVNLLGQTIFLEDPCISD